jgi:hypothetical protein
MNTFFSGIRDDLPISADAIDFNLLQTIKNFERFI